MSTAIKIQKIVKILPERFRERFAGLVEQMLMKL